MPGGNSAWTPWIELSDGTALPQGPNGVYANRVTAGWFQTMGTRVVVGREFHVADRTGSPRVVVVNQAFAERFLGLYGVTAYTVARRRFEIGIRMALGAAPGSVMRLVLARVIVLVSGGMALGLIGSIGTARFIRSMLYNVEPGDAVTFAGSCALLITVATLAGWLPARRAARIDPTNVLKDA